MQVWIYTDTSHGIGHPDQLKVFATGEAADAWLAEHDPEGVAFSYPVLSSGGCQRRSPSLKPEATTTSNAGASLVTDRSGCRSG